MGHRWHGCEYSPEGASRYTAARRARMHTSARRQKRAADARRGQPPRHVHSHMQVLMGIGNQDQQQERSCGPACSTADRAERSAHQPRPHTAMGGAQRRRPIQAAVDAHAEHGPAAQHHVAMLQMQIGGDGAGEARRRRGARTARDRARRAGRTRRKGRRAPDRAAALRSQRRDRRPRRNDFTRGDHTRRPLALFIVHGGSGGF